MSAYGVYIPVAKAALSPQTDRGVVGKIPTIT
jgi:hypothetical protein